MWTEQLKRRVMAEWREDLVQMQLGTYQAPCPHPHSIVCDPGPISPQATQARSVFARNRAKQIALLGRVG